MQTDVDERAALGRLVVDLQRFETQFAASKAAEEAVLYNVVADLERLEERLNEENAPPHEFDFFEVLNLWWQEDIHSRVLTWLLGPDNNHGLGDYFLKSFLLETGFVFDPDYADDWLHAKSQREWYCIVDGGAGWLDILVVDCEKKVLCAVENKIFSPEGGRQLTHYRKALEIQYPNWIRHHVFLSPKGMESQWDDEREYWNPMTYTSVLKLVEETIDDDIEINEDVRVVLRQYANTLRRRIVPASSELQQLARKIYLQHREAIEFIYNHKPSYQAEINDIIQEEIAQRNDWSLEDCVTSYVRFLPKEWTRYKYLRTGTGWPSKSVALFEFHCTGDNAYLCFTLAPGQDELLSWTLYKN